MKRVNFLTILFIVSLAFLVILFLFMVYAYPSSSYPDWMSEMWSHMGGGMMGGTSAPYLGYFGVLFIILIVLVVVSVVGIIYFLLLPEINFGQTQTQINTEFSKKPKAIESIRKTLNYDEQKILEVLENHNGKYLQKYLGKEAGLSRLKTHRILVRFAERGIVTLEKKGNTNEVKLEEWLKKT